MSRARGVKSTRGQQPASERGPFDRKNHPSGRPTMEAVRIYMRLWDWLCNSLGPVRLTPSSSPSVAKEYMGKLIDVLRVFLRPPSLTEDEMMYYCFHHSAPFYERVKDLPQFVEPVLVWLGDNGMSGSFARLQANLNQATTLAHRHDSAALPPVGIVLSKNKDPETLRDEQYAFPGDLRWALEEMAGTLSQAVDGLSSRAQRKGKVEKTSIKDGFKFNLGQVLFDEEDLELPSGGLREILEKLVNSFGVVVEDEGFNECSSGAGDTLCKSISVLRSYLRKAQVPCDIKRKTNAGYLIRETPRPQGKKKRVRKR